MKFSHVTISGADDSVKPAELVIFARDFPFVEWGILFSNNRQGTPRYPSDDWIFRLRQYQLNLSAHLCGQMARDALLGKDRWWFDSPVSAMFPRIQINGFSNAGLKFPTFDEIFREFKTRPNVEYIMQIQTADAMSAAHKLSLSRPNISGLYDVSGGRGIAPSEWPEPPGTLRLGYAGGINASNVESILSELIQKPGSNSFWIDMESGVRTSDDKLDLALVLDVLEKVKVVVKRNES